MGVVLGGNRYGKSGVRLVRVTRGADRHELVDLTVDVALEGDFTAAHVAGDNSAVLPTDTMRGTVYAFAGEGPVGEPEAFGLRLAGHFVDTVPAVGLARVSIVQVPWERIEAGGAPHRHAFVAGGGGRRTATVTRAGGQAWVVAGLADLLVLKTTGSGFEGFLKDGSPPWPRPTTASWPPSWRPAGGTRPWRSTGPRRSPRCAGCCWRPSPATTRAARCSTPCGPWARRSSTGGPRSPRSA